MGSKWRKAKLALRHNLCISVPRTEDDSLPAAALGQRLSDVELLSRVSWAVDSSGTLLPVPLSPGSGLSKSGSRSSKKICSICLARMRRRDGHAIFTAECSHSFHFDCIVSNVKHGNQICPVCRAKWKEIPFHNPILNPTRITPVDLPQDTGFTIPLHRSPTTSLDFNLRNTPRQQTPEPPTFDDDETLDHHPEPTCTSFNKKAAGEYHDVIDRRVEMKAFPEFLATPWSKYSDNFMVLVNVKAAVDSSRVSPLANHPSFPAAGQAPRAPVDLVTVLDISGSMAGTKLALLKRAMGFVIQNLGPNDRLSVVTFSSTAMRLFPLRRMFGPGRQQALQAVNSLVANGGTDIVAGLRMAVKVMEERKYKNPVAGMILLSDGQDTYNFNGGAGAGAGARHGHLPDYHSLLPLLVRGGVPIHAFGFGADHDATLMHSISENSGGTFSFIETEAVIQDAFAQCIGGILSVVVQEMQVRIECAHPSLHICSLKAGSYPIWTSDDDRVGVIDVGDMYADEERDFLVSVNVPAEAASCRETLLLEVRCSYKDPFSEEIVTVEMEKVRIERCEIGEEVAVSMEVDRQRNRLRAAEAMAEAREAAEQGGDLGGAVSILEMCRAALLETLSGRSGDRLCMVLDAELKEMQDRMASRNVYQSSGRAYILSGMSSHSWQRATARGDSTDVSSMVQSYQTRRMSEMILESQKMLPVSPSGRVVIRPLRSLGSLPKSR